MPRKAAEQVEESWFPRAARLIVREGMNLRGAASELEINATSAECEAIYKSEAFQKVLREERHKFNREVANTPGRDKTSALGLLAILIEKLIEEGEYEKAVVALEKLMKAEGWTGAESNINVFAGLSPKEYTQLMEEIDGKEGKAAPSGKGTPTKTSVQ